MRRALSGLAPLLLLAGVAAAHWPPPGSGFAYDDVDLIERNHALRAPGAVLRVFALPFPPEQPERALYRPLTAASYALDLALWGEGGARGFHFTNLVLYAAIALQVLWLGRRYHPSPGFGLAVALLFAAHPVHCDAVDSLAGRSELLALLFALLALMALQSSLGGSRRAGLVAVGAYAAACLAKETGLAWLAVFAVHLWVWRPPARGRPAQWLAALRPLAPFAAVALVYLGLRAAVLGQFSPDAAILRDHDLTARLSTAGAVFFANLQLLAWPQVLQVDFYYQAVIGLAERPSPASWLGGLAATGLALLAVRELRRLPDASAPAPGAPLRDGPIALCGLAILGATLLPTSHLLDFGALLAERFLFAPSLGFVLLVVLAGRALLRALPPTPARALAVVVVAGLTALGLGRSHARALEWRDPVELWRSAARRLPDDVRVQTNLAHEALERGELDLARSALERALAVEPDYAPALGNLGIVEIRSGRLDAAERLYRQLLERQPDDFLAHHNLGLIAAQRGDEEAAAASFCAALELNPNLVLSRQGLAALGLGEDHCPR